MALFWRPADQLPAAVRAVRALPELTFVLDHLSKSPIVTGELEPWADRLRELAGPPNVVCKLSGMVTEANPARWPVELTSSQVEVSCWPHDSRSRLGDSLASARDRDPRPRRGAHRPHSGPRAFQRRAHPSLVFSWGIDPDTEGMSRRELT
jgi:hypothetical protein